MSGGFVESVEFTQQSPEKIGVRENYNRPLFLNKPN
jgi:hypothetical protein